MAEGTMEGQEVATVEQRAEVPMISKEVRPSLPIFNGTIQPSDFEGLYRLSRAIAASGLTPQGIKTAEQVFVALAQGLEVGLSPMASLQNIAVVNGRPTIWGDSLLALVERSGELAEFEETTTGTPYKDDFAAVCRAVRKYPDGRTRGTSESFSVADAILAGLWGKAGTWKQYPKRMLKHRARSFALRDLFPDVLKGLRTTEEMQDAPPVPSSAPGAPFEVEDVPRTAQPEPAAPVVAEKETGQETAPTPAEEPPKRHRRTKAEMEAARAAEQKAAEPSKEEEQPPHPVEAVGENLPGVAGPKYAPGEVVETKWGPASVLKVNPEPHPENGWQYQIRREDDGGQHAGAEFYQYEGALTQPAAPESQEVPKGNGSAFLFCKRDQRQVNALVCDQRCQDRDDCPELAAHQQKTTAPVATPAGKPAAQKLF